MVHKCVYSEFAVPIHEKSSFCGLGPGYFVYLHDLGVILSVSEGTWKRNYKLIQHNRYGIQKKEILSKKRKICCCPTLGQQLFVLGVIDLRA